MKKILIILLLISAHLCYAKSNSILFLGDSLTEGLGVGKHHAFPQLVENLIVQKLNKNIKVINAGVSGSTTSDGLARLKWYLRKKPNIIFIALGSNDGLRGLNLQQSQKNLEQIIEYAQQYKIKILLAGMLIPPNYGPTYTNEFKTMYQNISVKYKIRTMPFLLKGVAGEQQLNQKDGIHPNEKGHQVIALNVFEFIKQDL